MSIKNIFGHLKTIFKHKYWVFYYCCLAHIPFRGIVHDLSKLSKEEFFESVKYFTGKKSPIDICRSVNGYSNAWVHHKAKNKHHYEYWVDGIDKGGIPIKMPYKYAVEMICDFLGAGRAYNGNNFSYLGELNWWYRKKSHNIKMHKHTQEFVTNVLTELSNRPHGVKVILGKEIKDLYNRIGD